MLCVAYVPIFQNKIPKAYYCAEPIPLVGHIRTQVGLYQYENARLPFDDAEAGTVTTWRNTDDGNYEPIQFNLKANANREPVAATNNILSRLEMPLSDMMGKRISPDQIQLACLVPGGVSEDGATTNAYAYAVGVFGGGERLSTGTGYAVLEAFFPDVVTTNEAGVVETGYRFVATWEDYNKGETPIRFGYAGESYASDVAVCPLIPPEAFAPGAVTKLRGDGPDSVEYWVERLRDAPCGLWAYSLP